MIRVLLVDDSSTIRAILRKIIDSQYDLRVCAESADGLQSIDAYREHDPDIVIMDVEMPALDGIGALERILKMDPAARVIMCSSLTHAGGDVAMKALRIGAIDCILKPSSEALNTQTGTFAETLVGKIRSSARKKPSPSVTPVLDPLHAMAGIVERNPDAPPTPYTLRPAPPSFKKADIIAIGSSTGGVQALFSVLEKLGTDKPSAPIIITQHMPPTFTHILAAHIKQKTGLDACEAQSGMPVMPGRVYIAPGNYHMEVIRGEKGLHIRLSDGPLENFCRPSIDPMLRSVLAADIPHVLIAILTGMGNDGLAGSRAAVEKGHMLIAQDEKTSIVWGMPGAVATAGLCHAVLPLDQIGVHIARYL